MNQCRGLTVICCALVLAAALPLAAADGIHHGADLWQTSTGFTFTTFAKNPIPADFFCAGSKPFGGVISMHGEPLATRPAGALGHIDTIIRRLDEAPFDANGEATTRIQLMALSLASVKPVEIPGCGSYDVRASLAGEQPLTEMKIRRTSSAGGTYVAPLDLKVKLVFTPVDGKGAVREISNHISLGPGSNSVWAYPKGAAKMAVRRSGNVEVDTNGDGTPDSLVPAPSNFVAGFDPAAINAVARCQTQSCHCAETSTDPYEPNGCCDHLHCVPVVVDCSKPVATLRPSPTPCPVVVAPGQ
jgi:hypothetical protein